jgi:hypothetical protein
VRDADDADLAGVELGLGKQYAVRSNREAA